MSDTVLNGGGTSLKKTIKISPPGTLYSLLPSLPSYIPPSLIFNRCVYVLQYMFISECCLYNVWIQMCTHAWGRTKSMLTLMSVDSGWQSENSNWKQKFLTRSAKLQSLCSPLSTTAVFSHSSELGGPSGKFPGREAIKILPFKVF